MKKKFLYIVLFGFFLAAAGFVVVKYKSKQASEKRLTYPFLNRNHQNNIVEWEFAKKKADVLLAKILADPDDIKSALALANAYITESRISGNYAYYDKAAFKIVSNVLEKQPNNYEALTLKSLLQLSQHHFSEGLTTAQLAAGINPNNAFVYGLLVDANIEMGNYKAALEAADKMVTIRPDIRSYARIAYLREIHGDLPGAIEAMKLAVTAGVPGEESTEWCRVQLGRLYENVGEVNNALYQYKLSLAARPDYANALHGMARIAAFNKKQDSTIFFLEQASQLVNDLDIKQHLALAYSHIHQIKKAEGIYLELSREIETNQKMLAEDPDAGHYADKEIAYFFIQQEDYDKALEYALAEYNRRPQNNDVNELMAWVYYKKNEIAKAQLHIEKAMRTGNKNPALLSAAGLIYCKAGDKQKGKKLLEQSVANNPVIPIAIAQESKSVLEKI